MRGICFGFSLKMAVALGSKQDGGLRTNVEQPTEEQPQKTELPGTLRGHPIPALIPTAIQNAAVTPGQSSPSSEAKSKVLVCYVNKDTRQRVPAGKVAIELPHELPVLDLEIDPTGCIQFFAPPGRYAQTASGCRLSSVQKRLLDQNIIPSADRCSTQFRDQISCQPQGDRVSCFVIKSQGLYQFSGLKSERQI